MTENVFFVFKMYTGFVRFFRLKIQGLFNTFKDIFSIFQGPQAL